jgi:hypothetical protein
MRKQAEAKGPKWYSSIFHAVDGLASNNRLARPTWSGTGQYSLMVADRHCGHAGLMAFQASTENVYAKVKLALMQWATP